MGRADAAITVPAPPADAMDAWVHIDRWASFIDGFSSVVEATPDWPEEGARLVWQSVSGGRGQVTERVTDYEAPPPGPDTSLQSNPGRLVTRVEEEALTGSQTVTFTPHPDGTRVDMELDYELTRSGLLQPVTDLFFIRRAVRDSLRRTLGRFEALPEAQGRSPE